MKKLIMSGCTIIILLAPVLIQGKESKNREKISGIDDLPRHTYDVSGTLSELVTRKETFVPFAAQVRANVERDLVKYDIEDKTTLKKYYGVLTTLDIIDGQYENALAGISRLRDLEDKSADKLITRLIDEAIVRARIDDGNEQNVAMYLSQAIEELPWEPLQDRIEAIKGQLDMFSRNVVLGMIQSQYERIAEKSHQIGNDIAFDMIDTYYLLEIVLPYKESIGEVLDTYIAAHRVEQRDIWAVRSVDLSEVTGLTPVTIAIWDTGVDTAVFPGQLYQNSGETINGEDDDGNGYVDDVHGVAYTLAVDKTPELLYPIEHPESLGVMKDLIKGLNDIQAAVTSPEAEALKKRIADMNPDEVGPFIEQIMQFGLYMHGTYTAGLAVQGNPYARILTARLTDDYRMVPQAATIEKARKWGAMFGEVIDYFKKHGVRVVNMSWTGRLRARESNLEVNAIGKNAEERARMAREMFNIEKESLFQAMKEAQEILFVTSAGNEDDDVAFEDHYPNAFDLPNLLVVGAVDRAGHETSFTSFGKTVDVYADGFEVESYIPGGEKLPASGTSAASPNAANLAAKLFAVEPTLTAEQVIALIVDGADQNENGRPLINPRHSLEILEAQQPN